jgi:hypothetical protein
VESSGGNSLLPAHSRVERTLKHYACVQLADARSALDALPSFPTENLPEVLRATGTDGASALASCLSFSEGFQQTSVDSNRQKGHQNHEAETRENLMNSRLFPVKQRGSEEEAPPGFEPGMADLQSAALPLGEGAVCCKYLLLLV